MQFLPVGEKVAIEYQISGEHNPEAILFIPGLGADLRQFDQQHKAFQDEFCVVSVSLPGHGQSQPLTPETKINFDLQKFAGQLIDLMDALGHSRFHLVGNSLGGLVCYELMLLDAARVSSLTTFGTPAEVKSGLLGNLQFIFDQIMDPRVLAWLARFTASKDPQSAALVSEMMRKTPRQVIASYRQRLNEYNYLHVLQKHHQVPFLLLRGQQDMEINMLLFSTLKTLEKRKNVMVRTVEKAGHFLNLDQPQLFANALRTFIRGHATPQSLS